MVVLFDFYVFPLLSQEELSHVTSLILYTTPHYQHAQQPYALVKHFTDQQRAMIQALSWTVPTYIYRWPYLPLHNCPQHIHLGYTFASARHDHNTPIGDVEEDPSGDVIKSLQEDLQGQFLQQIATHLTMAITDWVGNSFWFVLGWGPRDFWVVI